MEATSENEQVFSSKKALSLSQQVSPRRHCTGSLQNRVWRRLLRMSRFFLSKKIPSHFLSRLAPEDTALAPSRIEYIGDFLEWAGECDLLKFDTISLVRCDLQCLFKLCTNTHKVREHIFHSNFLMLNAFMGSLKHLAKGWLMPIDTKVKIDTIFSDVCLSLRYFCND